LALFAEFDAVPGPSPVLSVPMQIALLLYHPGKYVALVRLVTDPERYTPTPNDAIVAVSGLLSKVRTELTVRRREENVLVQRLSTDGGGYLAGYMAVKNLLRSMRARDVRFNDSDFFLAFVKYHIYGDRGLVDVLVDSMQATDHSFSSLEKT